MKKSSLKIGLALIFIIHLLSFNGCKNVDDKIPYAYVNIRISLNSPDFTALNAIGNSVYVTGGVKGIIVYRYSTDRFLAYERACPFDPDCGRVFVEKNGISVRDNSCCNSVFSLVLDGNVIEGVASAPLRQYQVMFNQQMNELLLTN